MGGAADANKLFIVYRGKKLIAASNETPCTNSP